MNNHVRFWCGYKVSAHFETHTYQGVWWQNCMIKNMFSFVRNCSPVFQSGYMVLHSHQQWMRVPIIQYACQHLVLSLFWILTVLTDIYILTFTPRQLPKTSVFKCFSLDYLRWLTYQKGAGIKKKEKGKTTLLWNLYTSHCHIWSNSTL